MRHHGLSSSLIKHNLTFNYSNARTAVGLSTAVRIRKVSDIKGLSEFKRIVPMISLENS